MASSWVEFSVVKKAVTMRMVLDHYQVRELKESRGELRGRCPISKCKDDDPFSASISKNCFQCFVCKRKGNVLDFVAVMEKCSVRDAAVKLADWFSVPATNGSGERSEQGRDAAGESRGEDAAENKPLAFELKNVDPAHAYVRDRGITQQTAEIFGVGFFSGKGSMSGRVVIPIRNERGELVAYAGRSIDGSEPKYKFPPGFHKSLELFNLYRPTLGGESMARTVVLVEGFFGCIKVYHAGFQTCVALMGTSMSEAQEELICRYFTGAVLMFDGDDAGQAATDDCLLRLGRRIWVKAAIVPEGKDPSDLGPEEIGKLIEG